MAEQKKESGTGGTDLATKIEGTAAKPDMVRDLIERHEPQFRVALAGTIDPAKFSRVALTAIRASEGLQNASVPSLLGALMGCAQLGLEPHGPLGHAYLVPFKKEVQLIIGYQGMIELAYRSGRVASINARVVKEGDEYFDYEFGTNEYIRHRPGDGTGEVTFSYAVGKLVSGGQSMVVLNRLEVDRLRDRSKAGKSGPWTTDFDAMARKTAVRQLFKFLPASVETQAALGVDGGVFHEIPESIEDLGEVIDIPTDEEV